MRDLAKSGKYKSNEYAKLKERYDELLDIEYKIENPNNLEYGYGLYNRLAGEVEARNAQRRMNMTPEERRATLLRETEDVSREDQIIIMDAFDKAQAYLDSRAEADSELEAAKAFTPISNEQTEALLEALNTGIAKEVILYDGETDERIKEFKDREEFKNKNGVVYGFATKDGRIFIDKTKMNANTPIHEYGHLYWPTMPEEIRAKITNLLKQTARWKELENNPAYSHLKTDNQKANEIFNTILGDYGENSQRVNEIIGRDITLKARILNAIREFWEWLKSKFGNTDAKINQFAKKTLGELLSGKPLQPEKPVYKGGDILDFSQQVTDWNEIEKIKTAKQKIQKVLDAEKDTSKRIHEELFEVKPEIAKRIKEITGIDVRGYKHSIDRSEINHAISRHTNPKIEDSRGQVPITNEDFLIIPDVIDNPDKIRGIGKDRIGRETIVFEKTTPEGNVIVYEAALTGKKELAFQTMFKKKSSEFMQNSPTPTSETTSEFRDKDTNISGNTKGNDENIMLHVVPGKPDVNANEPPKPNPGEGVLDYVKRITEYWAEQSKNKKKH